MPPIPLNSRIILFMPGILWMAVTSCSAMLFTDVTASARIYHKHFYSNEAFELAALYALMTGGAVAEDFDGDGWIDLYALTGGGSPNLLYMNQGDGTFQDEAIFRGAAITGSHMGATAADFDSDGDVDIFVSAVVGSHVLLVNDGGGHFTADSNMISLPINGASSPSFGDLDNDGLLELVLGAWIDQANNDVDDRMQIYRNTGNGQLDPFFTFKNEFDFTPHFADLDGDRSQDLLAVADFIGHTRWYLNDGTGLLYESDRSDIENGMGVSTGDIDSDGDLDVFITAIARFNNESNQFIPDGNRLLLNNGSGEFADITESAGVRNGAWGWGTDFADFDNDGDLDIYMVNGFPLDMDVRSVDDARSRLFENLGNNTFNEIATASGDADQSGQGRSVVVFDYDNDGDLDIFVVNNSIPTKTSEPGGASSYEFDPASPVLLRNDTVNDNHFLKVVLEGITAPHNAQGIGSRVYVTTGELEQMRELNASSGYAGHGPARIAHFGLGDNQTVDRIRAVWTNGDITELQNVLADQTVTIKSPLAQLSARSIKPGDSITATYPTDVLPSGSTVTWILNGMEYADQATLQFNEPGSYFITARIQDQLGTTLWLEVVLISVSGESQDPRSIAQVWNEQNLNAIRIDFPDPTTHARNLFASSVAMWDAWAAYEPTAAGVLHHESVSSGNLQADRRESISYAAYRVLKNRYSNSVNASITTLALDQQMQDLGYDSGIVTTDGDSPAALGNRIAESVLSFMNTDGWNNTSGFMGSAYQAINDPLLVTGPGTMMNDPNHWQPLEFDQAFTQNQQVADLIQEFLGPHWGAVRPFALTSLQDQELLHLDPGPPPWIGTSTDSEFKHGSATVIQFSSLLDPDQNHMINISPGAYGNNSLGLNDGAGHQLNPVTGQPYQDNFVNHADFGRVLAEFWADGPDSETPPGHWNTLANSLHEYPDFQRLYLGKGSELDRLEWDVKLYLALNGAVHDAAIAAWGCKRVYDYVRPISSIRYMGSLGQSSNPSGASYHPQGLPLIANLIEVITPETSASGQRHEHLANHIGEMAILAWSASNNGNTGGVDWILAENWLPYQKTTFVTPAFPGYVSGHSTFSRAAAEVLARMTGSSYFPGGMGTFTARKDEFLEFEEGPTTDVILQWATYYDAADQAGISRIYGGIHVPADDGPGRVIGSLAGIYAWDLAVKYFDASILEEPIFPELVYQAPDSIELRWNSVRGSFYKVQFSDDLSGSDFTNITNWIQSTNTTETFDVPVSPKGFYRIIRSPDGN